MRPRVPAASLLASLLVLACGEPSGAPPPPAAVDCTVPGPYRGTVVEGISYVAAGGAPRALDLARPPGEGPFPWVLVLHGGGWRAGERAHVRHEIRVLAGQGIAAAAVSYRLFAGDRGSFPAAISDVRCALRHLRREAPRLGLDPDRGALVGYSAGGHLALLAGLARDVPDLDDGTCSDGRTSTEVRGVVAFFPPTDLRRGALDGTYADRVVDGFLGGPDRAGAELASPLLHVDRDDPPVFLAHGALDRVVPVRQSRALAAALDGAEVRRVLVELPEEGHGFLLFSREPAHRAAACGGYRFLREVLE
jgi:acetyl esterase/lipase